MPMEQERTVNSMIECRQISKSFPGENGSMEIVHSMNLSVGEMSLSCSWDPAMRQDHNH